MVRFRRRQPGGRRAWDDDHRCFLTHGMSVSSSTTWDEFSSTPQSELPAEVVDEMADAWLVFGEEIMGHVETDRARWCGCRPYGWWLCESTELRDESLDSGEQLERLGQLAEWELKELKRCACGPGNEYYTPQFRRSWSWWRFLSPERRDSAVSEAEQLCRMGADTLTQRERYIVANHDDLPEIKARTHYYHYYQLDHLSDAEILFLGLPMETGENR